MKAALVVQNQYSNATAAPKAVLDFRNCKGIM
jgi:hypothetical protein